MDDRHIVKFPKQVQNIHACELDLMKDAAESLVNVPDGYTTMVANEQDVKGLYFFQEIKKMKKLITSFYLFHHLSP